MKLLALVALVLLVACTPRPRMAAHVVATSTVTTALVSMPPARPLPVRASRSRSLVPLDAGGTAAGDPFWDHLADCESSNTNEAGGGYWQIIDSTWRQAGERGRAMDYDRAHQLVVAKRWAARIHPNEGTRSGWPVCWWRALAANGGGSW